MSRPERGPLWRSDRRRTLQTSAGGRASVTVGARRVRVTGALLARSPARPLTRGASVLALGDRPRTAVGSASQDQLRSRTPLHRPLRPTRPLPGLLSSAPRRGSIVPALVSAWFRRSAVVQRSSRDCPD